MSSPHPHLTHDHTANPEVLSRVSKGIRLGALGLSGAGAILDFNETL